MYEAEKNFFQQLEESLAKQPKEVQGATFRPCAVNCVKEYVMAEQRRMFEECHGDMDLMFSKYEDTEYVFRRVIEKGHIYEMGYPKCLCYMYESGFAKSSVHCECSKQSLKYVLEELFPDKKMKYEIIQTVLAGADKCVFRITVEG